MKLRRVAIRRQPKNVHLWTAGDIELSRRLAEQGIVIVSGLAMGVDATAHRAALEAGGVAIAVLPCPIEKIVPSMNRRLAEQILEQGGALVSEYAANEHPVKQNFIARNRLMSGLPTPCWSPKPPKRAAPSTPPVSPWISIGISWPYPQNHRFQLCRLKQSDQKAARRLGYFIFRRALCFGAKRSPNRGREVAGRNATSNLARALMLHGHQRGELRGRGLVIV